MSETKLVTGIYNIVSLLEGNPAIGVTHALLPFQTVRLEGPVEKWRITGLGDQNYRFAIGAYHHTGVVHHKVTASIDSKVTTIWNVTFSELQQAYVIAPTDDRSRGWTAPSDSDDSENRHGSEIEIRPIIQLPTYPPRYLPPQLFKFIEIRDEE